MATFNKCYECSQDITVFGDHLNSQIKSAGGVCMVATCEWLECKSRGKEFVWAIFKSVKVKGDMIEGQGDNWAVKIKKRLNGEGFKGGDRMPKKGYFKYNEHNYDVTYTINGDSHNTFFIYLGLDPGVGHAIGVCRASSSAERKYLMFDVNKGEYWSKDANGVRDWFNWLWNEKYKALLAQQYYILTFTI